jgi:hypothetical protein
MIVCIVTGCPRNLRYHTAIFFVIFLAPVVRVLDTGCVEVGSGRACGHIRGHDDFFGRRISDD